MTKRLHFGRQLFGSWKPVNMLALGPIGDKNGAQERRRQRGEGEHLLGGQSATEGEQHSLDGGVGWLRVVLSPLLLSRPGTSEVITGTLIFHWDRHDASNAATLDRFALDTWRALPTLCIAAPGRDRDNGRSWDRLARRNPETCADQRGPLPASVGGLRGGKMYLLMIVLLMAVLPILSIVIEFVTAHGDPVLLVGRWFVFWGVGVRLALAALRQIAKPDFTAKTIFELTDPAAQKVVQELGFANLAIGVVGIASVFNAGWVIPAAVAGALFYGLAGLKHVFNARRNRLENIATISDLGLAIVLIAYLVAAALHA